MSCLLKFNLFLAIGNHQRNTIRLIRKIFLITGFIFFKIQAQTPSSLKASIEIDSLIKKDAWDLVHYKLNNENLQFRRLSKYPLRYHLLIKIDSANVLYRQGKYQQSQQAILQSLNALEKDKTQLKMKDYEGLKYIIMTRLFYIEKRQGNIAMGLQYLNTLSKGMSPLYRKKQLILLAVSHMELGNYQKAIEILNKRLEYLQDDPKNSLYNSFLKQQEIASTYNTKSEVYIKWYKDSGQKQWLNFADENYENAYKTMENSPSFSSYSKVLNTSRKAEIKILKKQYEKALMLFNECEKNQDLMEKRFSREALWIGKAEAYTFLNNTDSAFYYIDKLFDEKSPVKNTFDNKLKIYHLLSINYENLGNNQEAYKFAKLSLSEMDKKNVQYAYGHQFLGQYEQNEIKAASEAVLKNQKWNYLLAGFISCTSLCVIFLISYQYRTSKRKKAISFSKGPETVSSNPQPNTPENIIDENLISTILQKLEAIEASGAYLSNNFKLSNAAKLLNTNTSYLSQIVNQYKGVSFTEYVNNLRINYVLNELNHNPKFRKYTIQTITEEVGYKSTTTFIKAFKKRVDMFPSDYIKQVENCKN